MAATYLYLLDAVSHEIELPDGRRIGLVAGLTPVTLAAIAEGIGLAGEPIKTARNAVSRAIALLEKHGVILVRRCGRDGLRVAILDSPRRFKLKGQVTPLAQVPDRRFKHFPELKALCEVSERPGFSGHWYGQTSGTTGTLDDNGPGMPGSSEAEGDLPLLDTHTKADNHPLTSPDGDASGGSLYMHTPRAGEANGEACAPKPALEESGDAEGGDTSAITPEDQLLASIRRGDFALAPRGTDRDAWEQARRRWMLEQAERLTAATPPATA
ncbi:MAG: hypothetical protein JSV65_05085 [Armatimonadota bacterium]|nr:MAG: hypothetical protein JSV65_05085 [Armatimonadota bacterium]